MITCRLSYERVRFGNFLLFFFFFFGGGVDDPPDPLTPLATGHTHSHTHTDTHTYIEMLPIDALYDLIHW